MGQIYWYALYPLHSLIFTGILRQIARARPPIAPTMNELCLTPAGLTHLLGSGRVARASVGNQEALLDRGAQAGRKVI